MNSLSIQVDGSRTSFSPGHEIRGRVSWAVAGRPDEIALRLFWYTKGKGDQDVGIAAEERYRSPAQDERREFVFRVPRGPYSFSGKLITLLWALELVAQPSGETERVELVAAPNSREVWLYS